MTAAPVPVPPDPDPPAPRPRGALTRVARRTLGKAWDDGIFSMAAQAAFWQALSLPPLFLGLLGSLGYVGGWFGPETVDIVEGKIVGFARRVFTPEVVDQLIAPTASSILTRGRADVVSVGFLIALWAGSSAIASVVDSITEAHGQYGVRHPVWQRLFSLLIYLSALVVAVFTLPLVALGPDLLPRLLPEAWRATAAAVVETFYYPGVGMLLVLVLTTVYRAALPHSPPWRRLLPGALLAMLVFVAAATGLRVYLAVLTGHRLHLRRAGHPGRVPAVRVPAGAVDRARGTAQQRRPGGLARAAGALPAAGRAPYTGRPTPGRRPAAPRGADDEDRLARVRTGRPVPARGPRRM